MLGTPAKGWRRRQLGLEGAPALLGLREGSGNYSATRETWREICHLLFQTPAPGAWSSFLVSRRWQGPKHRHHFPLPFWAHEPRLEPEAPR